MSKYSSKYSRAFFLAGAAALPLYCGVADDAQAQQQATEIPEISATTSSPIRRGRTRIEVNAAPVPATQLPNFVGTLPIVTDQFSTVTIVPQAEMQRDGGATLGDLLMNKPGITGSSFAPGGSSRPVIRGLDNYRVRIQENGIGQNGVSDIAEDHAPPVDPLSANQVEVIRGPATLRYGSQAIGGVVNATNNRIPEMIPSRGIAGEMRGAFTSVDNGQEGAVVLDAGKGNFAFHADAFGRNANDYRIPGYPYLFPPDPPPIVGNTQPNSAARSNGQAAGGSYVFQNGFIGAAVSQFSSVYRIPGIEASETNTLIDMRQTKLASKGEVRPRENGIEAIRFWGGSTNYQHDEIANEGGFNGIQQTFTNKEQEGRIEVQSMPFDLRFATLTTAVGVQGMQQRLAAPGIEGGLFDPNRTNGVAGFLFNELRFGDRFRMQLAGRIERNTVKGSVPDLFVDPDVNINRDLSFTPKSGAVGILYDLPADLVLSGTAQYVQRAPRAPELLSRGPHEATGTFDIGNPNLKIEAANSFEVGLRRGKGPIRFEATLFQTRFNGFIFRNLTGETCDADFASCTPGGTGEELNQAVYLQRDATFRGAEFQMQYDVAPVATGLFGVDAQYDFVRATFTDGTNVPRIPPMRIGGGIYWRDANWLVRTGLLHAFSQNEITANETPTHGYNLLKAEVSHTRKLTPTDFGPREITVGLVGNNLLNADVRNSVSFKKDEVLMPGIGVRAFATIKF
ncbi:MAG TPA: TonB-dependent receptor [Xanthobacteraceae bacterium]|nr:TonB-dependent receptor [Xanthobacteraceae bacterium]